MKIHLAQVDAIVTIAPLLLVLLHFDEGGGNVQAFFRLLRVVVRRGQQRVVQFTVGVDVLPKLHGGRVLANDETAGRVRGEDPLAAHAFPKTTIETE